MYLQIRKPLIECSNLKAMDQDKCLILDEITSLDGDPYERGTGWRMIHSDSSAHIQSPNIPGSES